MYIAVVPPKVASVSSGFLMHLQPFRNNVVFQFLLLSTLSTLNLLEKWSVHHSILSGEPSLGNMTFQLLSPVCSSSSLRNINDL